MTMLIICLIFLLGLVASFFHILPNSVAFFFSLFMLVLLTSSVLQYIAFLTCNEVNYTLAGEDDLFKICRVEAIEF